MVKETLNWLIRTSRLEIYEKLLKRTRKEIKRSLYYVTRTTRPIGDLQKNIVMDKKRNKKNSVLRDWNQRNRDV